MIEFNPSLGTMRVSVGYSLKVPNDVEYASEEAHVGLSVEVPLPTAKTAEEVTDQALQLQAELHTAAKLAVFAQLGTDFDTSESGILTPVIVKPKRLEKKTSRPASQSRRPAGRRPQTQGNGGRPRSKAAGRDLEIVEIDGIEYFDQRPLKDDGTYAPNASDFKSVDKVDGRFAQLWITDKNGELNDGVCDALEAAGIEY